MQQIQHPLFGCVTNSTPLPLLSLPQIQGPLHFFHPKQYIMYSPFTKPNILRILLLNIN